MTTAPVRPVLAEQWAAANQAMLYRDLCRLRLLLKRRVLWLRAQWGPENASEYQGLLIRDVHADRLLAMRVSPTVVYPVLDRHQHEFQYCIYRA